MVDSDKPQVLTTVAELRAWRSLVDRKPLALVATMGNLHVGHAALIEAARPRADRVLVTIFVNPTQFAPGEDYAAYPRTFEEDLQLAKASGADAVFAPQPDEVYPGGLEAATTVDVPAFSGLLDGLSRPGHFRGVASVVARLFNLAAPDVALFGEKDYQQLLVIRRMVAELFFPLEIVGVPTVRETDGLALSSRNGYLTAAERAVAPRLYHALVAAAAALGEGRAEAEVERAGAVELDAAGFKTEYFAVRDAATLGPSVASGARIVLVAARLGTTRLIDNLRVEA